MSAISTVASPTKLYRCGLCRTDFASLQACMEHLMLHAEETLVSTKPSLPDGVSESQPTQTVDALNSSVLPRKCSVTMSGESDKCVPGTKVLATSSSCAAALSDITVAGDSVSDKGLQNLTATNRGTVVSKSLLSFVKPPTIQIQTHVNGTVSVQANCSQYLTQSNTDFLRNTCSNIHRAGDNVMAKASVDDVSRGMSASLGKDTVLHAEESVHELGVPNCTDSSSAAVGLGEQTFRSSSEVFTVLCDQRNNFVTCNLNQEEDSANSWHMDKLNTHQGHQQEDEPRCWGDKDSIQERGQSQGGQHCQPAGSVSRSALPHGLPEPPLEKLHYDLNSRLLHAPVKPTQVNVQCDQCCSTFPHPSALARHYTRHTGQRDYVCTTCGATFARSDTLSMHARIHSGQTPYACSSCGRTFRDRSYCRRHVARHGKALNATVISHLHRSGVTQGIGQVTVSEEEGGDGGVLKQNTVGVGGDDGVLKQNTVEAGGDGVLKQNIMGVGVGGDGGVFKQNTVRVGMGADGGVFKQNTSGVRGDGALKQNSVGMGGDGVLKRNMVREGGDGVLKQNMVGEGGDGVLKQNTVGVGGDGVLKQNTIEVTMEEEDSAVKHVEGGDGLRTQNRVTPADDELLQEEDALRENQEETVIGTLHFWEDGGEKGVIPNAEAERVELAPINSTMTEQKESSNLLAHRHLKEPGETGKEGGVAENGVSMCETIQPSTSPTASGLQVPLHIAHPDNSDIPHSAIEIEISELELTQGSGTGEYVYQCGDVIINVSQSSIDFVDNNPTLDGAQECVELVTVADSSCGVEQPSQQAENKVGLMTMETPTPDPGDMMANMGTDVMVSQPLSQTNGTDVTTAAASDMAVCRDNSVTSFSSGLEKKQRSPRVGERRWPCQECDAAFFHRAELKRHQTKHTGEKPYQCPICAKKVRDPSNLKRHIRTHTGERPYSCSVCDKTFRQTGHLAAHMRIHTGQRPYKCHVCPATFIELNHLRYHQKVHAGVRPHQCPQCHLSFIRSHELRRHMHVHSGDRSCKCHLCPATFSRIDSLTQHLIKKHEHKAPFQCPVCCQYFHKETLLDRHRAVMGHHGDTSKNTDAESNAENNVVADALCELARGRGSVAVRESASVLPFSAKLSGSVPSFSAKNSLQVLTSATTGTVTPTLSQVPVVSNVTSAGNAPSSSETVLSQAEIKSHVLGGVKLCSSTENVLQGVVVEGAVTGAQVVLLGSEPSVPGVGMLGTELISLHQCQVVEGNGGGGSTPV